MLIQVPTPVKVAPRSVNASNATMPHIAPCVILVIEPMLQLGYAMCNRVLLLIAIPVRQLTLLFVRVAIVDILLVVEGHLVRLFVGIVRSVLGRLAMMEILYQVTGVRLVVRCRVDSVVRIRLSM